MSHNRRWILASIPHGMPNRDAFRWEESTIPSLRDGEVLLKSHYISIDPGQRVYISGAGGADPVGKPVTGWAVGEIVESLDPAFPVGTFARDTLGQAGVQAYSALPGSDLIAVDTDVPLSAHLSTLGMPGLTAYFGLLHCARIAPGETVVISGASGAVGSVAGQIAKIRGCRVIGITSGAEKSDYIVSHLGFDLAVDRRDGDVGASLARACPDGIDVYYDNVGGAMLDTCLSHMRPAGRIAMCGSVSTYNAGEPVPNYNLFEILMRSLRLEGFYVGTYADRFAPAIAEMRGWITQGRLSHREQIAVGLENFPEVFLDVFRSDHLGKMVLQVDAEVGA